MDTDIPTAVMHGTKLGRAAIRIHVENKDWVVKVQPPCLSIFSRLSRKIVGGSLPFLNEGKINNQLNASSFKQFVYPRLIADKSPDYYLFEYLDGLQPIDRKSPDHRRKTSRALLELHAAKLTFSKPWLERILFQLLEAPSFRTIWFAFLFCRFYVALRVLFHVLRYAAVHRTVPGVLLHNDIGRSNLFLNSNSQIVMLDFEDAVFERKWILSDIVDLMFDVTAFTLDVWGVEAAWKQLSECLHISPQTICLQEQVRLCTLKRALTALPRSDNPEQIHAFLDFALHRDKFAAWYAQQTQLSRSVDFYHN